MVSLIVIVSHSHCYYFIVATQIINVYFHAGNIPALVRLLQAYLSKGAAAIVANNQLEPILGISRNLMGSRLHDFMSFALLESVVQYVPK